MTDLHPVIRKVHEHTRNWFLIVAPFICKICVWLISARWPHASAGDTLPHHLFYIFSWREPKLRIRQSFSGEMPTYASAGEKGPHLQVGIRQPKATCVYTSIFAGSDSMPYMTATAPMASPSDAASFSRTDEANMNYRQDRRSNKARYMYMLFTSALKGAAQWQLTASDRRGKCNLGGSDDDNYLYQG